MNDVKKELRKALQKHADDKMTRHLALTEIKINTYNSITRYMAYTNPLIPCSWIDYDPSIPEDHVTFCYTDSEPNGPTVLECRNKMMNDI